MVYKRSRKDAAVDIGVYGGSTLAVPIISKHWLDLPFCNMVGMATKFIEDLITGKWDKVSAAECGVVLGAGQFDTAALSSKEIGDKLITGEGEEALMRNPGKRDYRPGKRVIEVSIADVQRAILAMERTGIIKLKDFTLTEEFSVPIEMVVETKGLILPVGHHRIPGLDLPPCVYLFRYSPFTLSYLHYF